MAHIDRPGHSPQPGHSADDVRFHALFDADAAGGAAGECTPPADVLETSDGFEILIDLPGVTANEIRLVFSRGALIVAGRKQPAACAHREATFHLAERTFGRFVRAVRVSGAVDAGRATARLAGGELRVVLPRIEERRGRDIRIAVGQS